MNARFKMNLITLDIGNSRIKSGLFLNGELEWVKFLSFTDYITAYLSFWIDKYDISFIAYTNVNARQTTRLLEMSDGHQAQLLEITSNFRGPVINSYKAPATLGADRFAAAVGAKHAAGEAPALTVDVGTAITYDYVDNDSVYWGGAISPGMELRFKALHQFTSRLPLVKYKEEPPFIGRTTQECIRSGVQIGVAAEIKGFIGQYREEAGPDLKVFLTGGGAEDVKAYLGGAVDYFEPNLVLQGIYALAAAQVQHAD